MPVYRPSGSFTRAWSAPDSCAARSRCTRSGRATMLMDVSLSPVHVRCRIRLVLRFARSAARQPLHVHDVIVRRLELRLREIGQQAVVAPMAIHDDDLLATLSLIHISEPTRLLSIS